jgi:tRNA(Ile)-lysidine synthase
MPAAQAIFGPAFARALARTAATVREDLDYLDAQAAALLAEALAAGAAASGAAASGAAASGAAGNDDAETAAEPLTLLVAPLAAAHPAVRRRALHQAALLAGANAGGLNAAQVEALDQLAAGWRGQGPVALAGAISARRKCGKLEFRALPTANRSPKEA